MKIKYIALIASVAIVTLIAGCGGGDEHTDHDHDAATATGTISEEMMGSMHESMAAATANLTAYPLDVCLVSGEPLDSMGGPVMASFQGQEFKLCCEDCVKEFDADPQGVFDKLMSMHTETGMEAVEIEGTDHSEHE